MSEYYNTFVGHHGFNRTCKTIEDYLRKNVIKADKGLRLIQPPTGCDEGPRTCLPSQMFMLSKNE